MSAECRAWVIAIHMSSKIYRPQKPETLCPSGSHLLHSRTRGEWVPTRTLVAGEELTTAAGATRIVDIRRLDGEHRVFNLEVEGEHWYFVGEAGVLAHNGCAAKGPKSLARSGKREIPLRDGYTTRIDPAAPGEGGFHTHVYDKSGTEVAKVTGKGKYVKEHSGKRLAKPSELPNAVRNDINSVTKGRQALEKANSN
jgi:hypothetical protein